MRILICGLKIVLLATIIVTVFSGCNSKDEKTATPDLSIISFNPALTYGTVSDTDGNVYKTITIDSVTWMAENLRTTRFSNGDSIPLVIDSIAWSVLKTTAYCSYNNTLNSDTLKVYGRLYNFYTATDKRSIAPRGWHVADTTDWRKLMDYLISVTIAGGKLKEAGIVHWTGFNTDATNETGFTALPSGYRQDIKGVGVRGGYFYNLGNSANFWTASKKSTTDAWGYNILKEGSGCYKIAYKYKYGFSVRCVKNNSK